MTIAREASIKMGMLFFLFFIAGLEVNLSGTTSVFVNIAWALLFFVAVLGIGRWAAPRALRWIKARVSWPSGFIAVTAVVILLVSSIAEWLGIHAFLGAFLVGAALSGKDASPSTREARQAVTHFVLSFFAPIYFVSMGINVNFVVHFDLVLVLLIVIVASTSKIGAVLLGARLAGMPVDRQTLAIGFGLNARGATGIILAGVGLEHRLIDERVFVAVVIMALMTSLASAPAIKRLVLHNDAGALCFARETVDETV